jgi:hypothetical protein
MFLGKAISLTCFVCKPTPTVIDGNLGAINRHMECTTHLAKVVLNEKLGIIAKLNA